MTDQGSDRRAGSRKGIRNGGEESRLPADRGGEVVFGCEDAPCRGKYSLYRLREACDSGCTVDASGEKHSARGQKLLLSISRLLHLRRDMLMTTQLPPPERR
jgi:hypothetical protein